MNVDKGLIAKNINGQTESIAQHTNNVLVVAEEILKRIKKVLNTISQKLSDEFYADEALKSEEVTNFITNLVEYHDYGKINPNFQAHINGEHKSSDERKHAVYSFLLWLVNSLNEGTISDTRFMIAYGVIVGHHGKIKDFRRKVDSSMIENYYDYCESLTKWGAISEKEEEMVCDYLELKMRKGVILKDEYAFLLMKLAFSVLVISDSIASSEISANNYKEAIEYLLFRDIGKTTINEQIKNSPIARIVEESVLTSKDDFSKAKNLKEIRILLNKKSRASFDEDANIYVLEAPVGTGKTLSSLSLASEIMEKSKKQKLISVFPLNSVQTQYQETIQNDLKIESKFIDVVNSESLFGLEKEKEEVGFEINEANLWLFEASCLSSEFIITSHVRFFDTLTALSRKSALGFLNLKDSVVVIDEFQNYPYSYWEKIWHELNMLSDVFGVKWIFTTGTFPVSYEQLQEQYGSKTKYVLSEKENQELFSSTFVKDRCELEKLENYKNETLEETIADIIKDIKKKEEKGYTQFLICASFVKTTKEIHKFIEEEFDDEYTVYFLTGRHSREYKKEIIKRIAKHNQHRTDKIMLVTTKTVECGMDFDFDCGYKENDMFDSVEQLGGRVNRSNLRETASLVIFELNRKKFNKEKLYYFTDEVFGKLKGKEFRTLYEEMYEKNRMALAKGSEEMTDLFADFNLLNYKEAMNIIPKDGFLETIYLVRNEDKVEFEREIKEHSGTNSNSYAEKAKQSLLLRKELEKFQVTVSKYWLKKNEGEFCEMNFEGLTYFLMVKDENMDDILEKYELVSEEGIVVSFLEKDSEEKTYEFY